MPTTTSLTYIWNFGSLLGITLGVQIITGIILSMHYISDSNVAFNSVFHIVRDVNNGWLIRYIHANGASFFFIFVYIHIAKAIYYGGYLRVSLWISGIAIFFIMMGTAFLGYVLPWGQMSFWGATVITNFASAIPYIGKNIVCWVWGGFSVGAPTLSRFFAFHFILPFILSAMVIIHLILLHVNGSSNPLGIKNNYDFTSFHPYFLVKDLHGLVIASIFFSIIIFWFPNYLGDAENFIQANPLVTPVHIVPEWYFLFAYAILRWVPNKLLGLICLVLSILALCLLPFLHTSKKQSLSFRPIGKIFFWWFIFNFILLTWLGMKLVEYPYFNASIISSILYFSFLFLIPYSGKIDNRLIF